MDALTPYGSAYIKISCLGELGCKIACFVLSDYVYIFVIDKIGIYSTLKLN